MIDFSRNYFDLFGLAPAFRFDSAVLDRAFRELQTEVHPDRFAGGSDAQKRLALQSSARVNEAYRALKEPVRRGKRAEVQRISGQKVLPVIEFEDGTGYRAESKEMAARIKEGRLFEGKQTVT